jgi:hypothetical protein
LADVPSPVIIFLPMPAPFFLSLLYSAPLIGPLFTEVQADPGIRSTRMDGDRRPVAARICPVGPWTTAPPFARTSRQDHPPRHRRNPGSLPGLRQALLAAWSGASIPCATTMGWNSLSVGFRRRGPSRPELAKPRIPSDGTTEPGAIGPWVAAGKGFPSRILPAIPRELGGIHPPGRNPRLDSRHRISRFRRAREWRPERSVAVAPGEVTTASIFPHPPDNGSSWNSTTFPGAGLPFSGTPPLRPRGGSPGTPALGEPESASGSVRAPRQVRQRIPARPGSPWKSRDLIGSQR